MSEWERQYQQAAISISSPSSLDEQIFQTARRFKPIKEENRWASRAGSGCTALAVLALLIHPAQYLGALTPNQHPANGSNNAPLSDWQQRSDGTVRPGGSWFALRSQVQAGNYVELCNHWRRQQSGSIDQRLPRDLEEKAREHCRILPSRK